MPEGHKTHHFARKHSALLGGQKLSVTSPQGRFKDDARRVHRRVLDRVEAFGKHLFYSFDGDRIVHVHLGRYGSFRQSGTPSPEPRGKVRMRMVGELATLDLNGPSTCRVIDPMTRQEVVSRLGPDPLAAGSRADVWNSIATSKKPIGGLLLDQSIVSGVGNIFRAEVLFECGIHPEVPGNELTEEQFREVWKSLCKMMKTGLKYGQIIAVTAKEIKKPLSKVESTERFRVYGKSSCPRCQSPIQTIIVAARKIYVCENCQA
ncbi:MAG: DNA-formamidopyrimidine glycosylase family protein [Planctomycetota bacterium]